MPRKGKRSKRGFNGGLRWADIRNAEKQLAAAGTPVTLTGHFRKAMVPDNIAAGRSSKQQKRAVKHALSRQDEWIPRTLTRVEWGNLQSLEDGLVRVGRVHQKEVERFMKKVELLESKKIVVESELVRVNDLVSGLEVALKGLSVEKGNVDRAMQTLTDQVVGKATKWRKPTSELSNQTARKRRLALVTHVTEVLHGEPHSSTEEARYKLNPELLRTLAHQVLVSPPETAAEPTNVPVQQAAAAPTQRQQVIFINYLIVFPTK